MTADGERQVLGVDAARRRTALSGRHSSVVWFHRVLEILVRIRDHQLQAPQAAAGQDAGRGELTTVPRGAVEEPGFRRNARAGSRGGCADAGAAHLAETGAQRVLSGDRGHEEGPQGRKNRGGEPLEIGRCGRHVRLDLHVVEAAPDSARKSVPGLRFAVEAFRTPTVTSVQAPVFVAPPHTAAARSEQCRVVITDHRRLVGAPLR